jgi:hypothetical protein
VIKIIRMYFIELPVVINKSIGIWIAQHSR